MNARQSKKNNWEGTVEQIEGDRMHVHVLRSRKDWPGMMMELPVSILPEEDRLPELTGAYLRLWFHPWDKLNVRVIRRHWTPEDAEKCREHARKYLALFNLEPATQPEPA